MKKLAIWRRRARTAEAVDGLACEAPTQPPDESFDDTSSPSRRTRNTTGNCDHGKDAQDTVPAAFYRNPG